MKHGWEYRDFEKCLEKVVYTPKLQSSNYQENGKYPIVSQEDCLISGYWDKEDDVFRLVKPIVVFGDHTRILKYIDFDFVLGADGVKILQPTDDIKAKFLYYYLKWYDVPSLGYSRHYKLLKECIVPIPPTHVQEQICSLLDKMNRVIEAKKEQLKELDNLAQAIFYDMFGDPVTNEKGWETSTIDTISTEKLSYGSGASAVEYDGQTRYIRITDINDLGDLNEDVKSPSEIDDKYLLKEGDILFARSGATVGKTYCHNEKNGRCIYAGYLIKMRPNTSKVLPKYIFYYTKSEYYKAFIRNAQNAVAQPNINAKQYGALIIPIPPLPLQQAFAEKVEAIERQKELINQSLREVQTLFDSRMDYWFSEEDDDFGQLDKLD